MAAKPSIGRSCAHVLAKSGDTAYTVMPLLVIQAKYASAMVSQHIGFTDQSAGHQPIYGLG